jgi:hypothetical protein
MAPNEEFGRYATNGEEMIKSAITDYPPRHKHQEKVSRSLI